MWLIVMICVLVGYFMGSIPIIIDWLRDRRDG